jgi:hypothetical protein
MNCVKCNQENPIKKCKNGRELGCTSCYESKRCEHLKLKFQCKDCNDGNHILIKTMLLNSKRRDIKSNLYNEKEFIDYNYLNELLEKSKKCCYCSCDLQYKDYNKQLASIERRSNSIGHIKKNSVISCLGCNINQVGQRVKAI